MRTLFDDERTNLLPRDGTVYYFPNFLHQQESSYYFQALLNSIEWTQDEVVIFGKRHITKRKVAWYGSSNFAYTYSNSTKLARPWTSHLEELKQKSESICGADFNSCLLNLYHNGEEGMGYHSDDEKPLGINPAIASISLGAERKFTFKHKVTKKHAQ